MELLNMSHYFVYDDNEGSPRGRQSFQSVVKYHNLNANKHFMTHYSNAKYLTFLAQNETTPIARAQASKELEIANRKMDYWKRHPNFDINAIRTQTEELDKQWQATKR